MQKRDGNLVVKMTLLCNANCKSCTGRLKKYKENEEKYVSFDLFKRYIDAGEKAGFSYVTFSGGEPTLVKDLFDYIEYASSKGMTTRLMTNGSMLSDEYIRKLKQVGLSHICLSLYSTDFLEYTEIRNNKSLHEKAMQAAMRLSKYQNDFTLIMQTIVSRVNYKSLPELLDFAIDNGFHFLWTSLLEDAINLPNLRMQLNDCEHLNSVIIPQIEKRVHKIPVELQDDFMASAIHLKHLPQYSQGIYHPDNFTGCKMIGNMHILFPNGKLALCSGYDYFSKVDEIFNDDFFSTTDYAQQVEKMAPYCKYCPHNEHTSFGLKLVDINPI